MMKCILIFVLFSFSLVFAKKLIPRSDEWNAKFEEITKINVADFHRMPVPKEDVTFYLFSKQTKDHYVQIFDDELDIIDEDVEKIVFLIHGWTEFREREWYQDLKNAFLRQYPDWVIIQVDYSNAALDYYHISVSNAKYVGKHIGDFIYTICRRKKLSTSKIMLVGHSLGSHVAGYAAKEIKHLGLPKISRIISLDPAKPLFSDRPCDRRLCREDAEVVQVIHTDTVICGLTEPIGTIDFYPNGGEKQTCCEEVDNPFVFSEKNLCSHSRSYQYYIEAILNPSHFPSQKCQDWATYKEKRQECDDVIVNMGNLTSQDEGLFYLETNCNYPYGKPVSIKTEL